LDIAGLDSFVECVCLKRQNCSKNLVHCETLFGIENVNAFDASYFNARGAQVCYFTYFGKSSTVSAMVDLFLLQVLWCSSGIGMSQLNGCAIQFSWKF